MIGTDLKKLRVPQETLCVTPSVKAPLMQAVSKKFRQRWLNFLTAFAPAAFASESSLILVMNLFANFVILVTFGKET